MKRLTNALFNFHCLTGSSMDNEWQRELSKIDIPKRERRGTIPWSADLRWWFAEHHHDGTLLEAVKNVDLSKIFGGPFQEPPPPDEPFPPLPGVEEEELWTGPPVKYVNGGYPGTVHTIRLHTQYGTLSSTESYADRCFGMTEHSVKSVEDLKIVRYIYTQRAKYATTDRLPNGLPMTAFQSFLIEMAGVCNGVLIEADYPEEVEATVSLIEKLYEPVIVELAKTRKAIGSCENLSSEISAGYWDRYVGLELKRRVEVAGEHGVTTWSIHQDGTLLPLLGRLKEVGIKSVNGLTAAPSGDLSPLEMRKIAGPDIYLSGILPQSIFTPFYSDEAFEEYVREVVEFYKDDGKVTLGIGDMLPVNGLIERVERVIDIIEELTA